MPATTNAEFGLVLPVAAVEHWGFFINMSKVWSEHQTETLLDVPAETIPWPGMVPVVPFLIHFSNEPGQVPEPPFWWISWEGAGAASHRLP